MDTVFVKIAPYLANPLTLVGFVLLLFFGIHRLLITSKIIPPLEPSEGSKVVHALLRYGFIIALMMILLGFALQFWQSKGNTATSAIDRLEERHEELAEKYGVTQAAFKSFLKTLEEKQVPLEDLDSTLREIAKRYKDLQATPLKVAITNQ